MNDKRFVRWTITKQDGSTEVYEIPLEEYTEKVEKGQLIGISFKGYEWSEPEMVIKP